jgi:Yip1 domain
MASSPVQTSEAPERVNAIGRVFGTLFSPKATFESIARRPSWFLPVVLISLIALGVVGLFTHRGGWPSFFQRQNENSSQFQQASAEQQQRTLDAQLKYAPPVALIEGAIGPGLVVVILAAIFLGVFNLAVGTKINFAISMGIVSHAFMTGLISGVLGILVIALKDPSTVDLQNLIASNLGAFLSSGSPKWMVALLGSLDVFSFWTMILMAIGYSAAAPKKLSFGKAFICILIPWALYVMVKVGIAAAFS